ncbi:hypothetical protein J537_0568 [Acinetobacter baumannii 1437282]|nr:hypothetical protein J537_0568 [Acinetobacter baumannii 1437282]
MKKIILLTMLLGLTGCGDNNQSDIQTNSQANTLQKAEPTPALAKYSLVASPQTMGAVAPLAGWSITNSMVTGASTLIDAIKESKTSFAQVKPNAKQVAEVLRGGAAGVALTIAVDQLLGAVDWVMDPANNQIKFKVKPCLDCDPQVIPGIGFIPTEYVGYNGGDTSIIFTSAMEVCSYSLKFLPIGKGLISIQKAYAVDHLARPIPTQIGYRVSCDFTSSVYPNGANTHVGYVVADSEEKTLPLETVAEQVISNADADSLDAQVATTIAAQNILNDVVQVEPVVQELENNAEKPPCITVSGKVVTVGTYGYRHDKVPPSKPHYPYTGDHYNLYRANQNPNNGKCFWVESGAADASDGKLPPPNSIPIEPFL